MDQFYVVTLFIKVADPTEDAETVEGQLSERLTELSDIEDGTVIVERCDITRADDEDYNTNCE